MRKLKMAVALAATTLMIAACSGTGADAGAETETDQASTETETDAEEPAEEEETEEAPEASADPVSINFVTNFSAVADHAPYFVALEEGYYEAAGLDVKIEFGKGSADSAQRAGSGQADISIADTGTAIAAIGNGADLTVVGMIFDRSAHSIWTTEDSGITSPKDLEGRTVGVPSTDTQYILFPALAEANGVDADAVEFVNIAPQAKYAALGSGQVDAIFDYTTGAPFVHNAVGDAAVALPWADFGINLYNNAIVANDKFASEHPEALKAFLKASYEGWVFALENPDEAIDIFKAAVPTVDVTTFKENFAEGTLLFQTQTYADNGIGYMDETRMCETVDVINEYVEMQSNPECQDVYTNEFLPEPAIELPDSLRP